MHILLENDEQKIKILKSKLHHIRICIHDHFQLLGFLKTKIPGLLSHPPQKISDNVVMIQIFTQKTVTTSTLPVAVQEDG